MTASHPVFKPVTLPDFQNGNDKRNIEDEDEHDSQSWESALSGERGTDQIVKVQKKMRISSCSPRDLHECAGGGEMDPRGCNW